MPKPKRCAATVLQCAAPSPMMVGRPLRPLASSSRNDARRWPPASTGLRQRGAEPSAAAAAPAARAWARAHARLVATDPSCLRLDSSSSPYPGECRRRAGPRGAPPSRRAARCHGAPPRQDWSAGRGGRSFPQGNSQLPTRSVPLLCRRRSAAYRQRTRAAVRLVPPTRAADDRPQGQQLGHRAAWPGADHRRSRYPAAPSGRQRSGRRRSAALVRGARQPRVPSPYTRAACSVPPRSQGLSQTARTPPAPANFAVLDFFTRLVEPRW